ncbi:YhcG family protein [uncultured Ilyobacter sp.]|uniref:PDDEXK nuclease domain-containing protein n=1 Tax=uncultured Ilyobacter sp. TaxID=544433 RepID=UPI00374998F0
MVIDITDYHIFIKEIKEKVYRSQIKASISVNRELLNLYWEIAKGIVEKQRNSNWGDKVVERLSEKLKMEFPHMKGFSKRNIELMRKWYIYWNEDFTKQDVSQLSLENIFQIPWGHNIKIIQKSRSKEEAIFYVNNTIENNWSRNVLVHQIESGLYGREGKAVSNFKDKLPDTHSDLAIQTLKDPYLFDFLTLTERYNERELEDALVDNITKFLLELGSGFSYIGRQYKLEVGSEEFYIDLLFYHVRLHSYVVIELKTGDFKPEYAGKLNFYVSVVDDKLANKEVDRPTIGILICKSKNDMVVEYSLKGIEKPIGVSEYELTQVLPKELKSALPSVEELEAELENLEVE